MTLDEAIALARKYHEGQVDKGGRPYVEHPLRVMDRVSTDEGKLTAVMHDLLEDTPLSTVDLVAAGCPARVLEALDALTKRPGELYPDFVARAASNPIAHAVKLADIDDNLDPERLGRLDPEVAAGLRERYGRARRAWLRRFLRSRRRRSTRPGNPSQPRMVRTPASIARSAGTRPAVWSPGDRRRIWASAAPWGPALW